MYADVQEFLNLKGRQATTQRIEYTRQEGKNELSNGWDPYWGSNGIGGLEIHGVKVWEKTWETRCRRGRSVRSIHMEILENGFMATAVFRKMFIKVIIFITCEIYKYVIFPKNFVTCLLFQLKIVLKLSVGLFLHKF